MHTHTYPHTHAQWPCLSSLAACKCTGGGRGRDSDPERGRRDMQMQTCFPTGAQCQLSLHPAAGSPGPIRVQACTPKSYGIGLSLTSFLLLTLWKNNKGDWWEVSSRRNVSISEQGELKALKASFWSYSGSVFTHIFSIKHRKSEDKASFCTYFH